MIKIWKKSILSVISLTCLMMAASSVNADKIRDTTLIDDEVVNDERGDLIIMPQQKTEPLIIAPIETIEETNTDQNSDLIISPQDVTINEDGDNPEGSLIAPRNQNTEDNNINLFIPTLVGITLISGLLVSILLFKRKK